jgi:hypothetical protein
MTPEEVEARFQRIEMVLERTAQQQEATQSEVSQQRRENAEWFTEMRQLTESNARGLAETRLLTESNARGLAETRLLTESNARAIEASRNEFVESRAALREDMESATQMILDLGEYVREQNERAEQDRLEFRETVQRILDALQTRFSGNGHND